MKRGPHLLEAFRAGPAALAAVLRAPLVLLVVYGAFLLLELSVALPAWSAAARVLDHNPLARGADLAFVIDDLVRLHPEVGLRLGGALLAALLLGAFFQGGAVATLGLADVRGLLAGRFLAASGRWFFASLRCFAVFAVGLVLLSWGVEAAWSLVPEAARAGGNEGATVTWRLVLAAVWMLGFALLLVLQRLAFARLLLEGRRSALAAHVAAAWLVLRRPLAVAAAHVGLLIVWGLAVTAAALAVDRFAAAERIPAALLTGQVAALFTKASIVASAVLARRCWSFVPARRAGKAPPAGSAGRDAA